MSCPIRNVVPAASAIQGSDRMPSETTREQTLPVQIQRLLTQKDLCEIFSISKNHAYALMHSDGFPTIAINNRLYVEPGKLQKWLDTYTGRTYLL